MRTTKPSSIFLVFLNALILLVLLLPNLHPIGWILALPGIVIFIALSGVWQLLWEWLDRKFKFHSIIRIAGFILPVTLIIVLPLLGVGPTSAENKQAPSQSLSGDYQAYVRSESEGWTVEIQDREGVRLYYEQTDFVSFLNVYWIWGPENRFWLYNSDDGTVHCWHLQENSDWIHVLWAEEDNDQIGTPPTALYPGYAQ